MKIVIDARTLGCQPSGIGIYAYHYICELRKTGYELTLLSDVAESGEMSRLTGQGVPVLLYGKRVYRSVQVFRYFRFVREQLNRIQPDLFWEPNILIPGNLRGFRGKSMITIHDMFPVTQVPYFGWKYSLYFRLMLRRTVRFCDVVLYDSAETKRAAEQWLPALKRKRTFVQYVIVPRMAAGVGRPVGTGSGVAAIPTGPGTGDDAGNRKLPADYFLYVGNMEKRKGVDLLLDAYGEYRRRGGTLGLVLAGKRRESDVDARIARVTAEFPEAVYCGYVSEEEKQRLYRDCSCFLFPSRAEGFGICVLEAMNFYKPIIASDLSIFREIVGDAVIYFPLEGNRARQAGNLSRCMLELTCTVDRDAYDRAVKRYLPEPLGQRLAAILKTLESGKG